MTDFSFTLSRRRVAFTLLAIIVALIILNACTLVVEYHYGYDHAKGLVPMFRLNAERNVPTFFSASIILMTSALCFLTSHGHKASNKTMSNYWRLLGCIALFLSVDEASHIHEFFDDNKEWTDGLFAPTGVLDGPWVVVYGTLVTIFVLYFFRFFLKLPKVYKLIFGGAGALYVSGAIGVEMIGADIYYNHGETLIYEIVNSTEEVMEMSAVSTALVGLLTYIKEHFGDLTIRPS